MTPTTNAAKLWAAPIVACFGLALAAASPAYAATGCAQKTDGDQYSSGPHMAQQADQEQARNPTYNAQRTAGGGGLPSGVQQSERYAAQRTAGGGGLPSGVQRSERYAAQRTAGGIPPAVQESQQPNPSFRSQSRLASSGNPCPRG